MRQSLIKYSQKPSAVPPSGCGSSRKWYCLVTDWGKATVDIVFLKNEIQAN